MLQEKQDWSRRAGNYFHQRLMSTTYLSKTEHSGCNCFHWSLMKVHYYKLTLNFGIKILETDLVCGVRDLERMVDMDHISSISLASMPACSLWFSKQ